MKFCIDSISNISTQIKTGKTPSTKIPEYFNGKINWYTPADLSKAIYLNNSIRTITDKALTDNKAVIFEKDTVLISCIGDIGKLGIVSNISSSNQQITGIKLNDNIFSLYFYFWCKWNKTLFEKKSRKAIVSILNNEVLAKIKVSYPENYDDQIRIASLFSRIERLIEKRKESIQLLDEFLKSTFMDMFGDPVRNEKGWEKKAFGDLLFDIDSGKSPKCEARASISDEYGVLKLSAVTTCEYNENENKALPENIKPHSKYEIKNGDILFSRKNTYALVAACAYVFNTRPKLLMSDLIFRLNIKNTNEVHSIFLWKLLITDSQRKKIQSKAGGAAGSMPNISKTNLKTVLLPVPPIELQNKFVSVVENVESIKKKYQSSLEKFENLYGSLSQRAFKGELDLSRVTFEES